MSSPWWWWGGAAGKSGVAPPTPPPPPPDPLSLSIAGTPTTWYYRAKPFKSLYFQPGDCACKCQTWTDTFSRAALGADWEVISGEGWTTAAGVGLTATSDGMIAATRIMRPKCCGLPGIKLTWSGAYSTVRVYYDWIDSDNHQYAEVTKNDAASPGGGVYGKGTLAIYSVTNGDPPVLLAGPEDAYLTSIGGLNTLVVQFSLTGVADQVYAQALARFDYSGAYGAYYWAYQWASCLTQFAGNRCGFGVTAVDYQTDPPVFVECTLSDCGEVSSGYCATEWRLLG